VDRFGPAFEFLETLVSVEPPPGSGAAINLFGRSRLPEERRNHQE
jgi:hypothetical protein